VTIEPNGCHWCGNLPHHHGRRHHPAVGMHSWEPPTNEQRLQRMRARRAAAGRPNYQAEQVVQDQNGRRWLIVAAGLEAYLVRRLDWKQFDLEPRESAWAHAGCENATKRVEEQQQ
jgi:hypothetical protein